MTIFVKTRSYITFHTYSAFIGAVPGIYSVSATATVDIVVEVDQKPC